MRLSLAKTFILTSLALVTLSSSLAQAFWIRDHRLITTLAIQNLEACGLLPQTLQSDVQQILISANLNEDRNLLRKWATASHFYNPNKKISMRRDDASVTVGEAQGELEFLLGSNNSQEQTLEIYTDLGRALHYVQDAAVPAHVVPINHFIQDGFEGLAIDQLMTPLKPGSLECDALREMQPMAPSKALRSTALKTLSTLNEKFPYTVRGQIFEKSWQEAFWRPGLPSQFGEYGVWGNRFGTPGFKLDMARVHVEPTVFLEYKRQRVEQALLASELMIRWIEKDHPRRDQPEQKSAVTHFFKSFWKSENN